jgi:hypothetical protein
MSIEKKTFRVSFADHTQACELLPLGEIKISGCIFSMTVISHRANSIFIETLLSAFDVGLAIDAITNGLIITSFRDVTRPSNPITYSL